MPETGVVQVAVDAPQHSGLTGPLDYSSECPLVPGTLVRVPLGRREVSGLVWLSAKAAPVEASGTAGLAAPPVLRAVQQVMRSLPPLSPGWCELVDFAASYYQRSVGEVALSVLPPELRKLDDTQLQRRIDGLRKALTHSPPDVASVAPEASAEQGQVLAALDGLMANQASPVVLLHGATGSGKTEVYLRAAEQVLAAGRTASALCSFLMRLASCRSSSLRSSGGSTESATSPTLR